MSDDFKYQVSYKTPGGGQYKEGMINVRANSPEELDSALDQLLGGDEIGPGLISKILAADTLIHAAGVVASTPAPAQAPQQNGYQNRGGYQGRQQNGYQQRQNGYQNRNQGQGEGLPQPAGPPPLLPDGSPAVWKSGISQGGKGQPYGGWYDPNTKSFLR